MAVLFNRSKAGRECLQVPESERFESFYWNLCRLNGVVWMLFSIFVGRKATASQ
jgi:hypothetical protein